MKKTFCLLLCFIFLFGISGCKKEKEANLTCRQIVDVIKNAYGTSYAPNAPIPDEVLSTDFGLVLSDIDSYYGEMPQIGYASDRIVVVKASNGKAEAIAESFEQAQKEFLKDDMQYSNSAKVRSAVILTHEDYVCFFMLGENYPETQIGEEETEEESQFYSRQMQIGIDAWNSIFYESD